MKTFPLVLLVVALALPSFGEEAKTNVVTSAIPATNMIASSILTLPVSAAVVSAPFVLTNGILSQLEQTEVAEGGKAVFSFTLTNAGTYLIVGLANAAEESMNSFFVNMDAQPDDVMIWDIDLTTGFEERTVNWRGNGSSESGEFVPKRFKLTAGEHKLTIVGREPTQLKSISIRREGE